MLAAGILMHAGKPKASGNTLRHSESTLNHTMTEEGRSVWLTWRSGSVRGKGPDTGGSE